MTRGALLGVGQELAVGMVAGVISKGITLPISAVCVRQQLDAKQPTLFGSLRAIHRELGFLGLYSALQPSIPLALLPALTLYIHGTLLLALPTKYQKHPPGVFTFAIGAISNALATIPLYPMILVKSLSQSGEGNADGRGVLETVSRILQKEGMVGLYRGIEGQLVKGVVQQGMMMLCKQR
jgi:adenine nucleotide transporter 17